MADELALAGQPLKPDDIITYGFYLLLLICESRIHHNNKSLPITASVNIATKQPQQQNQFIFRTAANFQQSHHGRGGYRGRGRGGRFTSHAQGATLHLTNDVNNIHLQHEDYGSPDHIQVGNGADIQKNLLSIQCFCLDNNVFFEHASFFLVKDYLGNHLHRGPLSNGLYNFSTFLARLQSQALSSVCINVQSATPSPLHMASTSRPHTDLHIVSGSLARNATLSQYEDRLTPPLLSSPPCP
ncbi:hypothetical protein CK203_090772 [Vitis vinifera]|uniref:Uncharacterized protein n=1 Tax=Vitis vinifera TaxID=29760 RepID=A0A438BTZ1_VITVI|nr:hypothetical protein CK203_090772 [Vitis vinifera]